MNQPRLEHPTVKVRQVIDDYSAGRILIPEFQRDYVWKPNRAPKLIDSLYRGYPISSLLVWSSPIETRSRRIEPRRARSGNVGWLIDGQQRVITLARTLNGDQGIDVVFNPSQEGEFQFRLANAATMQDRNWYRVAEIWNDDLYRVLRRNIDSDRLEQQFERVRQVLDYEIPIVKMIDHGFEDAVFAFTRINTLGQKLKKQDIESARVAAKHTGFIADSVSPFLEGLQQKGFRRLNVMHLFRACAFIAHPDGRTRTPLHELEKKSVDAAWRKTEKATNDALGVIRSEFGLINMDILWSGAFLVPLIVLCATQGPRELKFGELAGWLALAALLHRYSGSSETTLDQDLKACRNPDPIGALLRNLKGIRPKLRATEQDFTGALADRSGMLAMYIACHHRGALDFFTGAQVGLASEVDRHHVLPRAQFPEKERFKADCVANIAFITSGSNKSINMAGPEVYLPKIDQRQRDSQCIPADKAVWTIDTADQFWHGRRQLLASAFNEFIKSAMPNRKL